MYDDDIKWTPIKDTGYSWGVRNGVVVFYSLIKEKEIERSAKFRKDGKRYTLSKYLRSLDPSIPNFRGKLSSDSTGHPGLYWVIFTPDNKCIQIKNLLKWCKENEMSYYKLYMTSRDIGTEYNGYKVRKINIMKGDNV